MGLTEKVVDAVVVGVDGSASGLAALDWAADQARLEHRPLTLVHAATLGAVSTREVDARTVSAVLHAEGRAALQEACRHASRRGVRDVRSELVLDDPSGVLLQASRHASLLVVGSHGRGPVARRLLGSVGVDLVRHARCPVVVRRPDGPAGGAAGGGVVVGVDRREHAVHTLQWAAALAEVRDLPLMVVHALAGERPTGAVPPGEPGHEVQWSQLHQLARQVRGDHPRVRVDLRLERGAPEQALLRAAVGADVLVLGAHTRLHALDPGHDDVPVRLLEHAPGVVAVVRRRD